MMRTLIAGAAILAAASVGGIASASAASGASQADARAGKIKYWHKAAPGYNSSGKTTLHYCVALKSRNKTAAIAAVGVGGDAQPFRTWPRGGSGYPGKTYKWGPGFSFEDYWVIKFLKNGKVRMSYEGGATLSRVSQKKFQKRCW